MIRKLWLKSAYVASGTWSLATKPATARRCRGGQLVFLDYPVNVKVRGGPGARNPHLDALFERARATSEAQVNTILSLADDLAAIPTDASDGDASARWNNGWFSGLDAISLYAMIRTLKPRRYVEIGSGNSTKFVRRAIDDAKLSTRVTSIDPFPRAEIDRVCDDVIRRPFEDVTLAAIGNFEPGDVLFLDGSHRVFQNSDTTAFFMDLLPSLKPGVIVQVHDIFLPFDYPERFVRQFWNEQYILAAWLLGRCDPAMILFPTAWISKDAPLRAKLEPLYQRLVNAGFTGALDGGSFWFRT